MAAEEKLSAVVSVRFTEQEVNELRRMAAGRPVSHLVRELALAGVEAPKAPAPLPIYGQTSSAPGNVSTVLTTNPYVSAPRHGRVVLANG